MYGQPQLLSRNPAFFYLLYCIWQLSWEFMQESLGLEHAQFNILYCAVSTLLILLPTILGKEDSSSLIIAIQRHFLSINLDNLPVLLKVVEIWILWKGVWQEIFDFRFFFMNQFPSGPLSIPLGFKCLQKLSAINYCRWHWYQCLGLVPDLHRFIIVPRRLFIPALQ